MVRQFNAVDEVRKHPGVAAGVVAVLAGIGLAALLLNQRSGRLDMSACGNVLIRVVGLTPRLCATVSMTLHVGCVTAPRG